MELRNILFYSKYGLPRQGGLFFTSPDLVCTQVIIPLF